MANVYSEPRPKGRPEGSYIALPLSLRRLLERLFHANSVANQF